jgi:receptor protein-tyrosine kinase
MNRLTDMASGRSPVQLEQRAEDRQIGALLIDAGKITPEDAERILRLQKQQGLRFGEAALQLRLVTEADIQRVLSNQFDYPYVHSAESGISPKVIAAYDPFSRQVELLRALRSQLMLRWFNSKQHMLAIASPGRRDGRSYLAANLAVVFSQLGERTLLIDADLRHSRLHELFGLSNRTGLSTLISGRGDDGVQRVPALVDLSVLPAGPTPPNPQELLGRELFKVLLEDLASQFDVVLIDTPAAESSADPQTLACLAQGTLLLARKHRTRLRQLEALHSSLTSLGARVVGSVLNTY